MSVSAHHHNYHPSITEWKLSSKSFTVNLILGEVKHPFSGCDHLCNWSYSHAIATVFGGGERERDGDRKQQKKSGDEEMKELFINTWTHCERLSD